MANIHEAPRPQEGLLRKYPNHSEGLPPIRGGENALFDLCDVPPLVIDGRTIPNAPGLEKKMADALAILCDHLGLPADGIPADGKFNGREIIASTKAYVDPETGETCLGADSLGLVEIIMDLEDKVGVVIPDEEAEAIGRVFHIAHYLNVKADEEQNPGTMAKWLKRREQEVAAFKAKKNK